MLISQVSQLDAIGLMQRLLLSGILFPVTLKRKPGGERGIKLLYEQHYMKLVRKSLRTVKRK